MKRSGSRRRAESAPRSLAGALAAVRGEVAPLTLLAAVQESWSEVAGATVAARAVPVAEKGGTVTVACASATWAQELDLMQAELLARLRQGLAASPFADSLERLRFTADASRHGGV